MSVTEPTVPRRYQVNNKTVAVLIRTVSTVLTPFRKPPEPRSRPAAYRRADDTPACLEKVSCSDASVSF
jgi:hypothetical protein